MRICDDLEVIDLRAVLPRRKWIIGRRSATTSQTWHYNGPAVDPARQAGDGLIGQLIADAKWQMRPGWGGTKDGAPHLMYHLVFAADGVIYLTCDLDELLWHCAHQDGNSRGLALHCPIGDRQPPTAAMLAALQRATDALRRRYSIPLGRVFGHLEWKHATACPGPSLMADLLQYRIGPPIAPEPTPVPDHVTRYRVRRDLTLPVNIRQDYRLDAPVAARYKPGTLIYVDVIKTGDGVNPRTLAADANGDRRWAHLARIPNEQADLGFLSMTLLEPA